MLNEFDLINFLKKGNSVSSPYVKLGIGDDAALTEIPPHYQLVSSVDTSISGVHFPAETPPADVGYKTLAVSLSDMAAMGAMPISVLLALTLPVVDTEWFSEFSRGFFELAQQFKLSLSGGDTTRGPLSISTFVEGIVPNGSALLRSGARIGDHIYVSGYLGNAGLALEQWKNKELTHPILLQALNRPIPRVSLGCALQEIASSAIDISDGFAQDLTHILQASEVGAEINLDNLPLSQLLLEYRSINEAQQLALTAGDDYELCFTVSPQKAESLGALSQRLNLKLSCVGKIVKAKGLKLYSEGHLVDAAHIKGYQHF